MYTGQQNVVTCLRTHEQACAVANKITNKILCHTELRKGYATKLTNSVALVHERTIPTERPPLVGEVSANFLRIKGCHMVSVADPLWP
jgi:hypothetical protein